MQRGASLTTSEHIDPASPPAQLADMEDPDSADIPEGAVRFNVTAEDIACALSEESLEVCCNPKVVLKAPAEVGGDRGGGGARSWVLTSMLCY